MRASVQKAEELALDVEDRNRPLVDGEEFSRSRWQLRDDHASLQNTAVELAVTPRIRQLGTASKHRDRRNQRQKQEDVVQFYHFDLPIIIAAGAPRVCRRAIDDALPLIPTLAPAPHAR